AGARLVHRPALRRHRYVRGPVLPRQRDVGGRGRDIGRRRGDAQPAARPHAGPGEKTPALDGSPSEPRRRTTGAGGARRRARDVLGPPWTRGTAVPRALT